MNKVLALIYKNIANTKKTLTIKYPAAGLLRNAVNAKMKKIMDLGVFTSTGGALASISDAYYTITNTVELAD